MSLNLGGSRSKQSSTSNSTSTTTTTPLAPSWASSLTQQVAGRVSGLTQINPNTLVAPVHALQSQAATGAGGLGSLSSNFGTALDQTRGILSSSGPQTQAVQASPFIQQYLNPYLSNVLDATDADLTANEGRVRAQQALDLAGSGAFGGSGVALTKSLTEGELARARATTLGTLRSEGFTQALGAAQQDAQRLQGANDLNAQLGGQQQDRVLAAARQLADISAGADANQRANIATQAQIGSLLRDIDQQQRQAPVTSAQQLVALLNGLPIQLFTGQQQQTNQFGRNTGTATEISAAVQIPLGK